MVKFHTFNSVLLSWSIALSQAQTTGGLGPYGCLPSTGLYDLPSCDYLNSTLTRCNATAAGVPFKTCFCTQDVLSSIVNCENEMRQCGQNYAFDSSAQAVLANWHSDCNAFITFSPTTPPLTSLTATFNQQICTALASSCLSFDVESISCSDSYTASTDLKSCFCRPTMLSLASECGYNGNISCKSTTAALSNIALFSQCQTTYSGSAYPTSFLPMPSSTSGISPAGASSVAASTSSSGAVSITKVSNSATATASPTAIITTAASSAKRLGCEGGLTAGLLAIMMMLMF